MVDRATNQPDEHPTALPTRRLAVDNGKTGSETPTTAVSTPKTPALSRLSVRCPDEAAAMLGISPDTFDKRVRPDVRVVKLSKRLSLVSVAELERWLSANAAYGDR